MNESVKPVELPALPDERAAFDAWCRDYFGPLTTRAEVSSMWVAWQARAALAAQADKPIIGHIKQAEWQSLSPEAQARLQEVVVKNDRATRIADGEARERMRNVVLGAAQADKPAPAPICSLCWESMGRAPPKAAPSAPVAEVMFVGCDDTDEMHAERCRFYEAWERFVEKTGRPPSFHDVWLLAKGLMNTDGRRVAPAAAPAVPATGPRFLLIAMNDDGRGHPTFCADEAAMRAALLPLMFFLGEGEQLSADHAEQFKANLEESLEDGSLAFEGDPGIHLFELSTAPQAVPADALDQFYLQDTRQYVGNDVMWWAKNGNGYTTDLRKAHVYTAAEATRQTHCRDTDRAWPKAAIDTIARPAVDMQCLPVVHP